MATDHPVTQAVRVLRAQGVAFTPHIYAWKEGGGTAASSAALGAPEHAVVKTLVMEDDQRRPLVVLMHGDKQVSTKNLARQIGARNVQPCKPDVADRHSGYQVGGKSAMPVYCQRTILELERIWINGGGRGFLVQIDPRDLVRVLRPILVDVAVDG
jgi:Cys-tRNA(Pro) deacylase